MQSGTVIGKYTVGTPLGHGGGGEVWKAWDTELSRWVALKFLKGGDPDELARFKREAQTCARLSHPNIAAVFEVGEALGRHYIAMQYVNGTTLAALPREDVAKLARHVRDAARAVHVAHELGIIHRDLKPANLMIEGERVFVMDFGLAKQSSAAPGLSASGMAIGTPAYMPPEQARGELRAVDTRSDVYSLGATLYELVTGSPPFTGDQVMDILMKVVTDEPAPGRSLRPGLDADIDTIIMKCLEKDPSRRYPSARALADDLDRWLAGEAIAARPASYAYRLSKSMRKRRSVLAALGVGLAAVIVALIWFQARELSRARAMERARVHLESARRKIEQIRLRARRPYDRAELRALSQRVEVDARLALVESPRLPEAWLAMATANELAWDRERALTFVESAIEAAPGFGTAYLDRVRLRLRLYEHARRQAYTAKLLPMTSEATALRMSLESDLAKVALLSRDATELLYGQALLDYADGNAEAAQGHLAKYLEAVPEDGRAHYYRCRALDDAKRSRESEEEAQRAIECDWGDPDARVRLACFHAERREFAASIEDFDVAIQVEPSRAGSWVMRSSAKLQSKDLDGALADCTEALRLNPQLADIHSVRGTILETKGEMEEAIASFAKAIEIEPNGWRHWIARGVFRYGRRDYRGAFEDFDASIRLEPSAVGHLDRGNARRELGDPDGAEADYAKAIELDPEYVLAYERRGALRLKQGELAGAESDYGMVIQRKPDSIRAFLMRGIVRARSKNPDGAFSDFTKCLDLDPREFDARANRAAIYYERGDAETAVRELRKTLDEAPPTWPRRAEIEQWIARWQRK